MEEGALRTSLRYVMNFLWILLFDKPFSQNYRDIRVNYESIPYEDRLKKEREFFTLVQKVFVSTVLSGLFLIIITASVFIARDYKKTDSIKDSSKHLAMKVYSELLADRD